MSTWTVSRAGRAAVALVSVAILVAGTLAIAPPALGAGPASSGSILAPIGHITPTALVPGSATTNRPVFAQPFRTLDEGALRAAKLHAAAVASRGNRGPIQTPQAPLAGFFNNLDRPGLNQLTVAPPDSTGAIGPNNYVEMVNQQIGVYDRSLNLLTSSDNGTFMGAGALVGHRSADPVGPQGGHWLYAALGVATGANMLLFGWSKTPDPNDLTNGWCRFGIAARPSSSTTTRSSGTTTTSSASARTSTTTARTTRSSRPTSSPSGSRRPVTASCSVGTVVYVADAANPLHNADGSTAFTPVPANTADSSAVGYIVAAHSPVDGTGSSAPKIMVWHWA